MRKYFQTAFLLLVLAGIVGRVTGQVDTPGPNNPTFHSWSGRNGTPCGSADCWVIGVLAAPRTAGGGTLTLRDSGTACGAGNCYFADAIALTANTTNAIIHFGVFAKGGLTVATTGTIDVTVYWTTSGGFH